MQEKKKRRRCYIKRSSSNQCQGSGSEHMKRSLPPKHRSWSIPRSLLHRTLDNRASQINTASISSKHCQFYKSIPNLEYSTFASPIPSSWTWTSFKPLARTSGINGIVPSKGEDSGLTLSSASFTPFATRTQQYVREQFGQSDEKVSQSRDKPHPDLSSN